MAYVSDIDLIFNAKQKNEVSEDDFQRLHAAAQALFRRDISITSAKVASNGEDVFDESWAGSGSLAEVLRLIRAGGCDVVSLTGVYESSQEWLIPIDITLQCGDERMTDQDRMSKCEKNIEVGNFAKVVSRIRSLMSPQRKKHFARDWNALGGKLRFCYKQLEMLAIAEERNLDWVPNYLEYLDLRPNESSAAEWKDTLWCFTVTLHL